MAYKFGDSFDTTVLSLMTAGNQKQVVFDKEKGLGGQYKSVYADPNCILPQGIGATLKCVKEASFSGEYPAHWVIVASKVCEGCQFATDCPAYNPDSADSNNLQINKEP